MTTFYRNVSTRRTDPESRKIETMEWAMLIGFLGVILVGILTNV